MIGGGEKKTFERAGVRVKVANHHGIAGGFHEILGGEKMTGFQFMRDVIESFAFTHGKRNFVDVALGELPEDFTAADRMIEQILSGFERAARMAARINFKRQRAADHSVAF